MHKKRLRENAEKDIERKYRKRYWEKIHKKIMRENAEKDIERKYRKR
jgi:hypothetical protein